MVIKNNKPPYFKDGSRCMPSSSTYQTIPAEMARIQINNIKCLTIFRRGDIINLTMRLLLLLVGCIFYFLSSFRTISVSIAGLSFTTVNR